MSDPYLDGDNLDQCRQALRDGKTLEYVAGYLHLDTELLGRLLQLPTAKLVEPAAGTEFDLWRVSELEGQL